MRATRRISKVLDLAPNATALDCIRAISSPACASLSALLDSRASSNPGNTIVSNSEQFRADTSANHLYTSLASRKLDQNSAEDRQGHAARFEGQLGYPPRSHLRACHTQTPHVCLSPWQLSPERGLGSKNGGFSNAAAERPREADGRSKDATSTSGDTDLANQGTSQPVVRPTPASQPQVEGVVSHPALIVTRNIEWGTVILGFEQANKYTVLDQDGNIVALLAEDMGGIGKEVGRQFLRTRRSFTATILSPEGQVILRLRRPLYLVNSTIYVEDAEGEVIGEVRQRFHLWQRNYDIYLDRQQVAVINSPLLAWEFAIRDANGGVLALIDRNFQGFGKELFTDAGKYVIHFGDKPEDAAEQAANTVQAAHPDKPRPDVTALARMRTDVAVIPTSTGNQLEVVRPLSVDERTLILATAVSIDFDYFSQHSHGSGLLPFGFMPFPGAPPVPYPSEGGEGSEVPPAGQEQGTAADSAGASHDSSEGSFNRGQGAEESFGNDQPGFGGEDSPDFGDIDDNAGWSSEIGDGEEGSTLGSLFDLGRDLFGSDD